MISSFRPDETHHSLACRKGGKGDDIRDSNKGDLGKGALNDNNEMKDKREVKANNTQKSSQDIFE